MSICMERELKKNINLIFTVCNVFLARIHLETKDRVNIIYRARAIPYISLSGGGYAVRGKFVDDTGQTIKIM